MARATRAGEQVVSDPGRFCVSKITFIEAWCRAKHRKREVFIDDIFRQSLFPHARWFARLIRWLAPEYFDCDMQMICRAAEADSLQEVCSVVNSYAGYQRERSLCRKWFKLRVSGRRMVDLAQQVMCACSLPQLGSRRAVDFYAYPISIGIHTGTRVCLQQSVHLELALPGFSTMTTSTNAHGPLPALPKHATVAIQSVLQEHRTFFESWIRLNGEGTNFIENVFWRTLYPHARWLVRPLNRIMKNYFRSDFEVIRWVGAATSVREVQLEISNYRYQHPESGLLRRVLRIRISGKRLVRLAGMVLPKK